MKSRAGSAKRRRRSTTRASRSSAQAQDVCHQVAARRASRRFRWSHLVPADRYEAFRCRRCGLGRGEVEVLVCTKHRGGSEMIKTMIAVALAAACAIGGANAQSFPTRPVTILVPLAAGGSTDTIGRIIAEGMRPHLGQPV